jgi:adenylate cyclase
MPRGERKLAAIMFTDIADFTVLGQKNEALALTLVEKHRRLIRPVLTRHGGKEVKTMGDSFLVNFPNALDAVRCAYDIQKTLRKFNFTVSGDKRLNVRIGLHLGDVVEQRGDISGDAVNVASRIEGLADIGGVCLTRQVYDQVQNKFELPLESIGMKALKNVKVPVELFRMKMPWREEKATPPSQSNKKRIVILPLANFSSRKSDEYLADGMTEELISAVSAVKGLSVISRTSAMSYRGTSKSVGQIGAELDVGTVLEGSVRKAGKRLRIAVQLIDVATQANVWGESYDRDFDDILLVQSEIARQVGQALEVRMSASVGKQLRRERVGNVEAYTTYLKGRQSWRERTREGNDRAVAYLEEALKLDPTLALAYAALADCYHVYGNYGWWVPREAAPRAKENALKAIDLDPSLAEPHASLAAVKGPYEHDWKGAEAELKRAMDLNPSYAIAHQWYSLQLWYRGRPEHSYQEMMAARNLDPLSRTISANLGWALMAIGRLKESAEHLEKLIESEPAYPVAHFNLAWTYFLDSKADDAIREMRSAVEFSDGDAIHRCDLALMLGLTGRREEALALIAKLKSASKAEYVEKGRIAFALFGVGKVDEGFTYLRAAYRDGSDSLYSFKRLPCFAKWRRDPRWKTIDSKLGFADD